MQGLETSTSSTTAARLAAAVLDGDFSPSEMGRAGQKSTMELDAREIPDGGCLSCDICVVGTGAAGLTVANELAGSGIELIVLEAGGRWFERPTQSLYGGEVVDPTTHSPLHQYRERRLGGTTSTWGGRCIPFDGIDFERRSYVPQSGWPFDASELEPFYRRAHSYCEVGQYSYEARDALSSDLPVSMVPGFAGKDVTLDRIERWSPPTHFGKRHTSVLRRSSRIRLLLHANCVRICTDAEGRQVESVTVAALDGRRFSIRARKFVLAMGGLETTRILLASNDVHKDGIGNHSDMLGRYYLSHVCGTVGPIKFKSNDVVFDYEKTVDGIYCRRRFWITEEAQRRYQITNFGAFLQHPDIIDPAHRSAILSAMYVTKALWVHKAPPEYSKRIALMGHPRRLLFGHVRNMLIGFPTLFAFSAKWLNKRILAKRRLPSVTLKSPTNTYYLHFNAEQCPNPSSRVDLTDVVDDLGVPRLRVDWRICDQDIHSITEALRMVNREILESGCAEWDYDHETASREVRNGLAVGGHHVGLTRMASTPNRGVVDENCCVHGVRNLYLASSSVFPTGSHANPTLTIVAMAIRLADLLKNQQ